MFGIDGGNSQKGVGHADLVMHEEYKLWLGHKTHSMFEGYSIDPDEDEIIEQGEKIAASLRNRRNLKVS
jgi:hypothetical protein